MMAQIEKYADDELMVSFGGAWLFDFLWRVPSGSIKIGYQPCRGNEEPVKMVEDESI